MSSYEDAAGELCCAGSIFSMKLVGFMSKVIKLLLTEVVGQCGIILSLTFSALTFPKDHGQYIPALTSHSGPVYTNKFSSKTISFPMRTKRLYCIVFVSFSYFFLCMETVFKSYRFQSISCRCKVKTQEKFAVSMKTI